MPKILILLETLEFQLKVTTNAATIRRSRVKISATINTRGIKCSKGTNFNDKKVINIRSSRVTI